MTAPTPEQMRALANNDALMFIEVGEDIRAALRAAADQLGAVHKYAEANYSASTVARQIVRMMKKVSDD